MSEHEERPFRYSVKSKGFAMHFSDETVHSHNGVLSLTESQHKELNKLLKSRKRADIVQEVTYIDQDAAERTAREYLEQHRRPSAHQGAAHSQANAENKDTSLKTVEPIEPKGGSLLNKVGASREAILAQDNPQNPANKPFIVTESDVIRAADIAPPSPEKTT